MRRRRGATIQDLRLAIDCLPVDTRTAMLSGIRSNTIIVGGYTDGRGGVCPMLAAHRAGGRTSFIYFAKAWDRYARAGRRARRATERELRILTTHLEASLLEDNGPSPDLSRAMAEHRDLLARRIGVPEPPLIRVFRRSGDAAPKPGASALARV
jgi:hypothetical protein